MGLCSGFRRRAGYLSRLFDDRGAEDGVPSLDPSFGHVPAVLGVRLRSDNEPAHVGVSARVDVVPALVAETIEHVTGQRSAGTS
jgi:hypothetical protein